MAKPLDRQVIVLTGASSGIGRETALRLADKGAKVVVSARREEPLDDLVAQIKEQGGEATAVSADVANYSEVEALAREAVNTYGRIDTWVNNAGVYLVGEFETIELEEARRLFDINFWGELHGCKAVLPILKEQGEGTIINISSATARRPIPLTSVYSASKAAVTGLSEALRSELEGTNIELSIIFPASIDTPLFDRARSKEGVAPRPVPPVYPPSEVASAIEKAAVSPRRVIYAGPAGLGFAIGNSLMPGVLDKVLGRARHVLVLSDKPKPDRGDDNLYEPVDDAPMTPKGGWRTPGYKTAELAGKVGLGLIALVLVRKLARR